MGQRADRRDFTWASGLGLGQGGKRQDRTLKSFFIQQFQFEKWCV